MQNPGYNTGNTIFSEGEWFPFKIHNLVQLQDDAWYYVLQDINGLKHFMSAEYYESYGLIIGTEITCKIDRINCTGRIFLEPKHPYYKEGEIYYFKVISFSNSDADKALIVQDISENSIAVPVYNNANLEVNLENMVSCVVKRIKKGLPILELCSNNS